MSGFGAQWIPCAGDNSEAESDVSGAGEKGQKRYWYPVLKSKCKWGSSVFAFLHVSDQVSNREPR